MAMMKGERCSSASPTVVLLIGAASGALEAAQPHLTAAHVQVVQARDLHEALVCVQQLQPAALLLAECTPPGDIQSMLRACRAQVDLPLVLWNALGEVREVLTAFESGADEVVTGRDSGRVVAAKVLALLRRTGVG